ncbi:hypothetical protein NK8_64280 (plasmid) [Caballeronia sp. NK8]|nr:hypothetical protein NK8_64280 [Caballeronia sp. NK8]
MKILKRPGSVASAGSSMDGLLRFAMDYPALLFLPACGGVVSFALLRLKRNYVEYGALLLRNSPRACKAAPVPTSKDAPNRASSLDTEELELRMLTALLGLCGLLSHSLNDGRTLRCISSGESSLEKQRLLSDATCAQWIAVKIVLLSSEAIEDRQPAWTDLKDTADASCTMRESMVSLCARPTLLGVQSASAAVDAFAARVETYKLLKRQTPCGAHSPEY